MESKSVEWKSLIYNLPNKVAKFLMNSLSDTLNTNANLSRWGKRSSANCKRCENRETVHHVLNACPMSLDEGRYTWRHDNILMYLAEAIQEGIHSFVDVIMYTDLKEERWTKEGISTIPLECTQTNLIPDICILWKNIKKLLILELSVPFEMNIPNAHEYKSNKYAPLVTDIEANGYSVVYLPLEIGSRGHISPDNATRLKRLLKETGSPVRLKQFQKNLSKLSIVSSFVIYYSKNSNKWETKLPLRVSKT